MLRRFVHSGQRFPALILAIACALAGALAATASARPGGFSPASSRSVHHHARHRHHRRHGALHANTVSGFIPFSAGYVGAEAERVVFFVDGHRRWIAHRRPFRFRGTGWLNTRALGNGSHVLAVRVFFVDHRVRTQRHPIFVRNAGGGGQHFSDRGAVAGTSRATGQLVGVVSPPAGGAPGPAVAAFDRATYAYTSVLSPSQEANRYQVMVLQATDADMVPQLKAANPNLKILVYQHLWFSRPSDTGAYTVCTTYANDLANHPDWFLRDASGNPIGTRGPGSYLMDFTNSSYQQACFARAIALAKSGGFDGIFMDDIVSSPQWDLPVGAPMPPAYPTLTAWQAAMGNLNANAAAAFHAAGLLAFANLAGMSSFAGLWEQWVAPLDGAEDEGWTGQSSGLSSGIWAWPQQVANVAWDEAHGKYTILHSYVTSEAGNTYGLASLLLVAGGRSSYMTSNAGYTSQEDWYPEYDTASQLGAPVGPYARLTNGVYERVFAHGIVLVNPTAQGVPAFSLGGHVYSGSGLTSVRSLAMGPMSGEILLEVG
jgi:hypothetical protein